MRFHRWDQELDRDVESEIFQNLALWCLLDIDQTVEVEHLIGSLLSGDVRPLVEYDFDYSALSVSDAANLRQAQAYFSKREDLDLGYDKLATAKRKFAEAEESSKMTNECFRKRALGEFQLLPRVERVLWHASRKISSILGDIPKLSDLRFRFGPGATTQIPRRMASARAKLGTTPACSNELSPLAPKVLAEMPLWAAAIREDLGLPEEGTIPLPIQAGKIAFVPKSAKEFRTIMVEPSLNTMCQAGIGSFMAERLRSCGVDIRDQTRNQHLARKGSVDGSLATVDLSSASDTLSTELVYDLLGLEWAAFLARFRTGNAELDGHVIRLEKFSSMGNGFTFPLETLVFYALAYGTCVEEGVSTRDVSAYGDDIIIPTEAYPLLALVLTSCGFKVNAQKSFAQGPFRESCGADFFSGTDIRPVYQKTRPHVHDLFRVHNFLYRRGDLRACEYLRSFLDQSLLIFGPDGYGDGHLLGEWVGRRKRAHALRGYGGYVFDTFTFKSRKSFRTYRHDRVLPAYSTYLTESEDIRGIPSDIAGWEPPFERSAEHGQDGSLGVTIPGVRGVNRISIYVFA